VPLGPGICLPPLASAIVNLDHCFPAAADGGAHPQRIPHSPVRSPGYLSCMHTRSSRPGPAPRGDDLPPGLAHTPMQPWPPQLLSKRMSVHPAPGGPVRAAGRTKDFDVRGRDTNTRVFGLPGIRDLQNWALRPNSEGPYWKGCSDISRCRTLLVQAVEGHW
jgi:hypothetical protein